jgi:hypothetical protein
MNRWLPFALAIAAAPLGAQDAREFRASGFAITIPAGFSQPLARPEVTLGEGYQSRGKDAMLVMLDLRSGLAPADTGVAARRPLFSDAARGALTARGLRIESGPEERVTADAIRGRFRVSAVADPGEKEPRGTIDLLIPLHGDTRLLIAGVLNVGPDGVRDADAARILDSFHPIDPPAMTCSRGSPDDGAGARERAAAPIRSPCRSPRIGRP